MTEKQQKKIAEGKRDEDVYDEEGREELEDEDEISPDEEGFMKGYEEDGKMAMCANCRKMFIEDFIEKEIDGEIYRFCSEKCTEKFKKKKE